MSSPRATRVLDNGTDQAPSRTESTTELGVTARPMLAPWDGAFMEPRGCNWWQSTANRTGAEAPKTSKTVAIRCDRLPREVHGKEGVDGSSPSEGSTKAPHNGGFVSGL